MSTRDYIYCPYCGKPLEMQAKYDKHRPTCPNCGFIHFRDPKVAVIGLVTNQDRVLLIQRAVDPEMGKWALPGGFMDAGEMPNTALQRELLEEINLPVEVGELITIFPMEGPAETRQGIVLAYRAAPVGDVPETFTCEDDVQDAGWFTRNNLPTELAFVLTEKLLATWPP